MHNALHYKAKPTIQFRQICFTAEKFSIQAILNSAFWYQSKASVVKSTDLLADLLENDPDAESSDEETVEESGKADLDVDFD